MILHMSLHEEWWYAMLEPYVHFVPLSHDMSDLPDVLEWVKANPEKVEQIGKNAAAFMDEYLGTDGNSEFVRRLLVALSDISYEIDMKAEIHTRSLQPWPCQPFSNQANEHNV